MNPLRRSRSRIRSLAPLALCVLALFAPTAARAAEPTAAELLQTYDDIMGPQTFETLAVMTAWRDDGSTRAYEMRMLKGENDRFRVWFLAPASVKGQEMLRVGDNLWLYLPNIKRATRVANRDNFQGGDFNNADVLRVKYADDYTATLGTSQDPGSYLLELKAKSENTAYDAIRLWIRKKDRMPVRGEYFGTSGQLLRSAVFSDFTEFARGYTRPARVVMQNELVKSRKSELLLKKLTLKVDAPPQRFTQTALGR